MHDVCTKSPTHPPLVNTPPSHKLHKHDINVTWHKCDQPGCEYRAKTTSDIRQHKQHTHKIEHQTTGQAFFSCDQCEFKSKVRRASGVASRAF